MNGVVAFTLKAVLGIDISEYEKGLEKSKDLAGNVGGAIGNGLKTAAKIGAVAIGAASSAVSAFAVSSVNAGRDFDKSMSQVAATMGKTMDEMVNETGTVELAWGTFSGNLREYAQEMGKNTAFSATEAADALNYMALAGYDAQTSMEMLPNVLNLAAAGNMDLARASDMVTDTQTAFGISLERTSQMVDEMAKAASTGNTSVEQLGDAFLTVGGLAQELNGGFINLEDGSRVAYDNVQELEIALTAMANAGIKGSEAGTHMRNMLLKLASPTKDGVKAFENLGVSVFDSEGNMRSIAGIMEDLDASMSELTQEEKLQAISDIFNTRDTAAAEALMNAVGQDWADIAESILDADGAAQQMADTQLDNLEGDITLFKSALEGAQIAVSDGLSPSLREFVKFGTSGLSQLTEGFQKGGITGAMDAFGSILKDGIGMITKMLPSAIKAGMNLLGAVGQGILDNLPAIVDASVSIVTELAKGMVEGLPALGEGVISLIESLGESFESNSATLLEVGKKLLGLVTQGITEGIPMLASMAVETVKSFASFLAENGVTLAQTAGELIHSLITGIVEFIPEVISSATDIVVGLVLALTDPTMLTQLVMGAGELIMALANGLLEAIPKLIDAIPQIISNLVAALMTALPQITIVAIQLMIGLATALVQAIPRLVAAIPAILLALVGGLKRGVELMIQVGKDMIAGLWKGIKERWDSMVQDFKNLANGFIDGVKGLFGIHSPSTVFADIGKNLDAGLARGIADNMGMVDDAIGNLEAYSSIDPQINTISNTTTSGYSDIISLLKQIASNKNVTVVLEGDAERLFRVMQRESARNKVITGQESFA